MNRRLDSIEKVERQTKEREVARNKKESQINWQFTTSDARKKLNRLYPKMEA